MSQPGLEGLREKLLRAGIAPRHVKRYVAELRDHFDDLVDEEMNQGAAKPAAEDAARRRLGSDETLAQALLSRGELRSVTARYPWVVFGIGPVLMLVGVVFVAVLLEASFVHRSPPAEIKAYIAAWNWCINYAAPLVLAFALAATGIRQRISPAWIVLGLALICVAGGFHEVFVDWSKTASKQSALEVGFGLWPPFPRAMIISGIYRALTNLALVAAAFGIWLRRGAATASG